MEQGYTKGEWVAKFNGVTDTWEVGTTDEAANIGIAKLWSGKGYEANAHLIAAAPDMYEALKQAEDWFQKHSSSPTGVFAQQIIHKALAKAEVNNG